MISKEKFIEFINVWKNFDTYLDELGELHINIWEDDRCGYFRDKYMELFCLAVGIDIGDTFNDLENYVYGYSDFKDIDEFYNHLCKIVKES